MVASAGSKGFRNMSRQGEVNVLEILRLWTYARSLDLVAGQDALQLVGTKAITGPGENAAKISNMKLDVHSRAALCRENSGDPRRSNTECYSRSR